MLSFDSDFNPSVIINFASCESGRLACEDCDHAGQCWSSDIVMLCGRCGARLFAPPRHLARRPRAVLEEMYRLWAAAGRPSLAGSLFGRWSWVDSDTWTIVHVSLFEDAGGLPVRRDRLIEFGAVAGCAGVSYS